MRLLALLIAAFGLDAGPAWAQQGTTGPVVIEGILPEDAGVDLAPGEQVIEMMVSPSIVRVPEAQPVPLYAPVEPAAAPPEPVVDPATGRLRDTPGWTGNTDGAVSIGCFPAGSCASLNAQ